MLVPKTTVNKDDPAKPCKHKIGSAREAADVKPIAIAK
jgi:hypothetical protein